MKESYFKYLYVCAPTDWFEGFQSIASWLYESDSEREATEKLCLFAEACHLASKSSYWEGDINFGPFISGLPDPKSDGHPLIFITFKQSNNGTTFLVSPIKIEYLEKTVQYGYYSKEEGWIESEK